MRVLFVGFGNVGRRIATILSRERSRFAGMKSLDDLVTVGIVTRKSGALISSSGVDLEEALEQMETYGRFDDNARHFCRVIAEEAVSSLDYDVMLELTTLSIENRGEPAISHVRTALKRGSHVLSANKGPVAFAYRELSELANLAGKKFLFETTVMDGAPVFNLCRLCLKGCVVESADGILNSTTNYILGRMEEGTEFDQAVHEAQKIGVAEEDPSYDIDGWDAAAKVAALANVLLGGDISPFEVEREGIRTIDRERVRKAAQSGRRLKLICRAWRDGRGVHGSVGVEEVKIDHHFAQVGGGGAVLRIHTDLMGPILVTQEDPDLYDTAYGVLVDMLSLNNNSN
jgi:homoserine dehydrogenase